VVAEAHVVETTTGVGGVLMRLGFTYKKGRRTYERDEG
jgi:transposase